VERLAESWHTLFVKLSHNKSLLVKQILDSGIVLVVVFGFGSVFTAQPLPNRGTLRKFIPGKRVMELNTPFLYYPGC
jgi:hypothetical protein